MTTINTTILFILLFSKKYKGPQWDFQLLVSIYRNINLKSGKPHLKYGKMFMK